MQELISRKSFFRKTIASAAAVFTGAGLWGGLARRRSAPDRKASIHPRRERRAVARGSIKT